MRGSMRDRILAAAVSVMRERGVTNTTTKEITRAAGVAEGSIYNHFANKTELVGACMAEVAGGIRDALTRLSGRVGKGAVEGNLAELAEAEIAFFTDFLPIAGPILGDHGLREWLRSGGPQTPSSTPHAARGGPHAPDGAPPTPGGDLHAEDSGPQAPGDGPPTPGGSPHAEGGPHMLGGGPPGAPWSRRQDSRSAHAPGGRPPTRPDHAVPDRTPPPGPSGTTGTSPPGARDERSFPTPPASLSETINLQPPDADGTDPRPTPPGAGSALAVGGASAASPGGLSDAAPPGPVMGHAVVIGYLEAERRGGRLAAGASAAYLAVSLIGACQQYAFVRLLAPTDAVTRIAGLPADPREYAREVVRTVLAGHLGTGDGE